MARKFMISMVAAVVAASAAVPATAAPADARTVNAAGASATAALNAAKKAQKVCFIAETTGSRLGQKVCQTRAEWENEGINVDKEIAEARK